MSEALVVVDSFAYYADAAVAKALLEEAGLKPILENVYSADVWTGAIGQIRVQVPESQADRARQLLREIRESTLRSWSRSRRPADPDSCIRCGAPMAPDADRCARCGFEATGEEVTEYANGPVPDRFLPYAYAPLGTRRFGLRPELIPAYVEDVKRAGREIKGWELWAHSAIGHVTLDIVEQGSAADLLKVAGSLPPDRAWDTYISPNVTHSLEMEEQ